MSPLRDARDSHVATISFFFLFPALTLCIQLFFVFLLALLIVLGVDAIPFELNRVPLDIRTDEDYLRGLAWDEKDEDTGIIDRFGTHI